MSFWQWENNFLPFPYEKKRLLLQHIKWDGTPQNPPSKPMQQTTEDGSLHDSLVGAHTDVLDTLCQLTIVDSETYFCSFDYHDIAPPENVKKYIEEDFLQSRSLAVYEYVYPLKKWL